MFRAEILWGKVICREQIGNLELQAIETLDNFRKVMTKLWLNPEETFLSHLLIVIGLSFKGEAELK